MRPFIQILVLCATIVAPPMLAAQFPAANEEPPAFSVGDWIRINVWGHSELGGEFAVGEDGTIIHPLYQSVNVLGLSREEVKAAVRAQLTRFVTDPVFTIEPMMRVAVGGAVSSPSIYTFPSYTSVAEAVTRAGPTPGAALNRVRVLRAGSTLRVDLTRPYREIAHIRLMSGDQIVVDPDRNLWRRYIRPGLQTAGSVASIAWLLLRISRVL